MKGSRVQVSDSARKSKVARPETSRKNRRKAICRRFFHGESRLAQRGGLSKAPLRQAAEKRRAKRSQVSDSAQEEEVAPTVRPLFLCPAGLEEGFEGSGKGLKRAWKGSGEGLEGARTGTGRGLDGSWRRAEKTREKFGEGPAKGQRRAGGEAGKWSEKELKRGREFILRQEANAPEASRRPATPQHTSAGRTTQRRTHGLPQIRTSQPGKRPNKSDIVAPPPDKNSVTQRLSQQDRTVTTPEYGPEVLHSSPNVLLLQ